MTFINHDTREINCKVIYFGPARAGKTANLETISRRIPADRRGQLVRLAGTDGRTQHFDFLPIFLGRVHGFATHLHLYSLPGALTLDNNRQLILKGVDGLVFVVDARKERLDENFESVENLRGYLSRNEVDFDGLPIVVQYNMRDFDSSLPVDRLAHALNPRELPSFAAHAKNGEGVLETLKTISGLVLARLVHRS